MVVPFIAMCIILVPIFYLLWVNGYLSTNCRRALLYVGKRGKHSRGATVSGCTGYVKTVLRVAESKQYQFDLDLMQEHGMIRLELQGKGKHTLASLDSSNRQTSIYLYRNQIYYLKATYQKASGRFNLTWE